MRWPALVLVAFAGLFLSACGTTLDPQAARLCKLERFYHGDPRPCDI